MWRGHGFLFGISLPEGLGLFDALSGWVGTLYTVWDTIIIPYGTESVHFWGGLMNSF